MDLHVPTCRRHYPGGPLGSDRSWDGLFQPFPIHPQRRRPSPSECKVGVHIGRFEACSTFTCVTACRLAASPKRHICLEGSDGFVTSTAAPIATGWSDPVAGWELHPLKSQHLFTAHTRSDPAKPSDRTFTGKSNGIMGCRPGPDPAKPPLYCLSFPSRPAASTRLETATPRARPSDTLRCYAAAVGKRLVLSAEDIQHTRPRVTTPNADRRRGQESSGQEEAKGVNQGPPAPGRQGLSVVQTGGPIDTQAAGRTVPGPRSRQEKSCVP